jgi:hypothetical protein
MPNRSTKKSKKIPTTVLIALIGLIGTIVTAVLSSPVVANLLSPKKLPPPTVEIVGPETVPFGKATYYTIVSTGAVRGEWSVGGFENNELFIVDPLPPSHQIYVQPTDNDRIGGVFIIAVTVYNKNGDIAKATKQFTIVP